MLKIYGTAMSRAGRTLWAAEELGLKFEHIPVAVPDSHKPDYLKVNPNGHIPAIDDDGTVVWESMAITLYLVEKYGKAPLWPSSVADRAHANQWSFWGMLEVEPHLITLLRNKMFLPPEQRSEEAIAGAVEALKAPLKVLDTQVGKHPYLLGSDFSVADLNVGSIMVLAPMTGLDFSAVPAAKAWLDKCMSRSAAQKSQTYK
jgi:glutathione S-transferase